MQHIIKDTDKIFKSVSVSGDFSLAELTGGIVSFVSSKMREAKNGSFYIEMDISGTENIRREKGQSKIIEEHVIKGKKSIIETYSLCFDGVGQEYDGKARVYFKKENSKIERQRIGNS
jgi:hypothetical protein